jgi:hypothetical protein
VWSLTHLKQFGFFAGLLVTIPENKINRFIWTSNKKQIEAYRL